VKPGQLKSGKKEDIEKVGKHPRGGMSFWLVGSRGIFGYFYFDKWFTLRVEKRRVWGQNVEKIKASPKSFIV